MVTEGWKDARILKIIRFEIESCSKAIIGGIVEHIKVDAGVRGILVSIERSKQLLLSTVLNLCQLMTERERKTIVKATMNHRIHQSREQFLRCKIIKSSTVYEHKQLELKLSPEKASN